MCLLQVSKVSAFDLTSLTVQDPHFPVPSSVPSPQTSIDFRPHSPSVPADRVPDHKLAYMKYISLEFFIHRKSVTMTL